VKNVLLAYIHPGVVRAEFMQSVMTEITKPEPDVSGVFNARSGPVLTIARNIVADAFLDNTDVAWLLMVDTDMMWSLDALPTLLASADPDERPLVGGLCYAESDGTMAPTIYQFSYDEEGALLVRNGEVEPDTMIRVNATGCGFLLAHRSVFEKITAKMPEIEHHWFAEMMIDDAQLGEDISFCVRAADAGVPIYVNTTVKVGHMRSIRIGDVGP
jgi:GT2 family glycosyltransferase